MAGSLNHIVNSDTGEFYPDRIENLGDAYEALEECFSLIIALTSGKKEVINAYLKLLGYPDIECDMK